MNLRQMEIVMDVDKLKVDLQATFMKYTTIKKWAYIKHDKDDTREHYHIGLHFGGASVSTEQVAKWFQLDFTDESGVEHTGENFIEKIKGRWTDYLLYLVHGNDSQKHKHQYSRSEIIANFDVDTEIESSKIIGDFEHYSYAQMLKYVDTLPISEKAKTYSQLEKLWKIRCQILTLNTDRKIEVVFVTGKAGCGKTYYAKKFLASLNYDFCISSSSNDPFQDYLGQKAIILDDLRDNSFEFQDLLKILDNNTSSSVRSRFANKVFNGEMIVITSSVPLFEWYKVNQFDRTDTVNQLYRRISCYVVVTKDEVTVFDEGINDYGRPNGLGQVYKNELAVIKKEKKARFDYKSAFGKICENSTDDENVFSSQPIQEKIF